MIVKISACRLFLPFHGLLREGVDEGEEVLKFINNDGVSRPGWCYPSISTIASIYSPLNLGAYLFFDVHFSRVLRCSRARSSSFREQ